MSDESNKNKKRSAYLLIVAGCMFFFVAVGGKQPAFYGLGAAFVAIGATNLRKSK